MTLWEKVQSLRDEILAVAARHGASNVRIFGAVTRGEDDELSDVDFLVTLGPNRSLLDHAGLILDLEALIGTSVDVVTDGGIKQRIRRRILREAVPL